MRKSRLARMIAGTVIAVASSLLLYQIEVGWYGIGWNWVLLLVVVLLSFSLGFWGIR